MEVDRNQLLTMLNGIKPAISRHGDDDMLKRIIFTGTDAVAYSESMCIVWPFVTDFRTVAPSDEIIQILNRITAEKVDLVYSKECLNIKTGKTRARIKTEPDSRVLGEVDNLLAATEATDWWQLPAQFLEAVRLCMFTTSKDNTQRALMCVHAIGNDVVSSDDFRISHFRMNDPVGHEMLIPQAACLEIVKNQAETYAVTETWLMFNADNNGNIMVASRVVPETYGDVEQFFDFEGERFELPADIVKHIDTVAVLAHGEHEIEKEITVEMEPGKITLRGERDVGWAVVDIDAKGFNPTPSLFGINPTFFKYILELTNDLTLTPEKGLFVKDAFRHLIGLTPKGMPK